MAYGLQAYHEDVCGKEFVGVCPQLHKSFNHSIFLVRKPTINRGAYSWIHNWHFQNYLLNVSFTTAERDNVEFNQDGDVLARYDIMNFQHNDDGTFTYVKIGDWNNHTLNFSDEIKPPNGTVKFSSVCSKPCAVGSYKVIKSRSNKSREIAFKNSSPFTPFMFYAMTWKWFNQVSLIWLFTIFFVDISRDWWCRTKLLLLDVRSVWTKSILEEWYFLWGLSIRLMAEPWENRLQLSLL